MNIQGKIHLISPVKNISSTFRKREFVIEYAENPLYPQFILFQFTQDKCEILDNYQKGQQVEVSFNLRGREWISPQGEVRYFNTLEAWRIQKVETVGAEKTPPVTLNSSAHEQNSDDLPF